MEVTACFSYECYINLSSLCNTAVNHTVTNLRGSCFTNLEKANTLASIFTLNVTIGDSPLTISSLTQELGLQDLIDVEICGQITYRLHNQDMSSMISITPTGTLTISPTAGDSIWIGTNDLKLEIVLADPDPNAIYA